LLPNQKLPRRGAGARWAFSSSSSLAFSLGLDVDDGHFDSVTRLAGGVVLDDGVVETKKKTNAQRDQRSYDYQWTNEIG